MNETILAVTKGLEVLEFGSVCDYVAEHIPYEGTNLFLYQRDWPYNNDAKVEEIRRLLNDDKNFPEFMLDLKKRSFEEMDAALVRELKRWGADGRLIAFARSTDSGRFELLTHSFWTFADLNLSTEVFALGGQDRYVDPKFVLAEFVSVDHPIFQHIKRQNQPDNEHSEAKDDIDDHHAETQERVAYKTGLPGRPTSRHHILAEVERRIAAGTIEASLAKEARALELWLKEAHPDAPPTTHKTIENLIRRSYRQAANSPPKSNSK